MNPEPLSSSTSPFPRRAVLSAAVDLGTPAQFLAYLVDCAETRSGASVAGISAPYASAMAGDAALRDAFLKADLLVPDGVGFVWGAHALGVPCGERIAIPDLCEKLLEAGDARKWKVFLYGATADLNTAALANLKSRFPNLSAVVGQHGYDQTEAAEEALIAKLRDEKFNLLIVARPSPDKEKFLARCCREAGVVGLAAGGYADVLAGAKKRAPDFVQAAGMEWLYRLLQDPAKLWKRIGWANVKFAASVVWNVTWGVPRRPWFAQPLLHVVAIVALVVLAYFKSLSAPYHFDDPEYILNNSAIRSLSTVSQITVLARRPLWWYSNAICYKLSESFGDHKPDIPDVRIFRAWNIACHAIAALALYGLLRRCLKIVVRASSLQIPPIELRPFAAAAIFATHPLCTESVTYISGRDNGMGGMFYLLGLYFAAIAFERLGSLQPATSVQWPAWFWPSFWTLFFGAAAIATKESHLSFPFAVPLVSFCFYRRAELPRISIGLVTGILLAFAALGWGVAGLREGRLWPATQLALALLVAGGLLGGSAAKAGKTFRSADAGFFQRRIGAHWAFLIIIAGLIVTAFLAIPYAYSRTIAAFTGYQGSSYVRSLCSQAYAVPSMLTRAIAPVSLTLSPNFNLTHSLNIDHQFPTITNPGDARTLLGGASILALSALAIFGAWRGWLGAFGVLLGLLAILPTNTVIERGDIVSERNFYLVAAGGACVIAWLAGGAARWIAKKIIALESTESSHSVALEAGIWTLILACCFAGPFAAFTTLRNNEWNDPYRLWKSAMDHSPEKMRVLYNFGVSARNSEESEAAFSRAIAIGEERSKRGDFRPDEAVEIKCFHLAYWQLAKIHLQRYLRGNREDFKALDSIKQIYESGLNRTAWDPDLAMTYSEFLVRRGRASEAVPMLRRSLELHAWADQLYLPLGIGCLESGNDFPAAADYLERALKLTDESTLGYTKEMPADYRAQVNAYLGVARARLKSPDKAKAAFREALRLNPDSVVPILFGYNSPRNLRLPEEKTQDATLNSISQLRRDVIVGLRDAAAALLATETGKDTLSFARLKEVFDYELNRRAEYQKKQLEKGIKDDPDKD